MLPEDNFPLEVSSIGLLMCAVDTNPTQHVVSLATAQKGGAFNRMVLV